MMQEAPDEIVFKGEEICMKPQGFSEILMRKSRHQDHGVSTIVGEDTPTQHGSSSFTSNRIFSFYFFILFLVIRIVVGFLVSF